MGLGTDISALPDLDPTFAVRTDRSVLVEALARRLQTPRGTLFYDEEYGYDVRELLNAALDEDAALRAQADIAAECEKDERVLSATPAFTFGPKTGDLLVSVSAVDAEGPFELVLRVSAVSVDILTPRPA
jgi:phage baseplate assembly protein W